MNRKYRSVEINMLLNTLKTLVSLVIPLVTFPYIAHVLQVDNLGKVNFVQSFISYISLIASLGFSTYAIREGGKYRNNDARMRDFTNQVFTINLITTVLAYLVLAICICLSDTLQKYIILLLIQSTVIIFTTLGVDWLNVIYEDYLYITVRSIIIQICSAVLVFTFVRTSNDYVRYLAIQAGTIGIVAISNFLYLGKKYYRPKIVYQTKVREHIKPILILFSNNVAVSIYLNIDNVMLGWFASEYFVGLYAVAVKIYGVCKQLISALYSVTVTRLTEYYSNKDFESFKSLLNNVLNNILVVTIPLIVGLYVTSEEVVMLLAGVEYREAITALKILDVTIIFAILGGAFAYCINLPMKKEKNNLMATSISAIENLFLNILAIPLWKANGAATTTLLSELTVLVLLVIKNRDGLAYINQKIVIKNILKCSISCLPIFFISLFLHKCQVGVFVYLVVAIPASIFFYFLINICLRNTCMVNLINGFFKKKSSR